MILVPVVAVKNIKSVAVLNLSLKGVIFYG